jgi:predicted Holliday junction resolvase-like endonuclease
MPQIDITASIGSLLDFYKRERQIFGRCPHCGLPFRLSDVKLTYGKDLLTRMRVERDQLQERLVNLETEIEDLEVAHESALEALNQRWEDRLENEADKALSKAKRRIRKDAIEQSRVSQLGKTLEKIAPMFPGFGHHPADVRPIFDPIDFVVFDGHFHGEVTDITFVEFKTGGGRMSDIQKSIRDAVHRKKVHFEERRLRKETLRLLTEGRAVADRRLID